MLRRRRPFALQPRLHPSKGLRADHRLKVTQVREVPLLYLDSTRIDRIPQHHVEALHAERCPATRPKAQRVHPPENLNPGETPACVFLERLSNVWGFRLIEHKTTADCGGAQIAQRGLKRPSSRPQRRLHSRLRPVGSNVIVELRKGRQHALHELPCRRVVDRLCHRPEGDTELLEEHAQHDVVMVITGKPAQVVDDQELHTTSVLSTETQKAL
uniref:Uncharacterized protein n=1 Tax=uncultured gamma proteobacterium HF4000_48E10 TaxID=723583 RepID=E7C8R6_9GAMM|nr:hypothetical protein [uncultured gamma proteobacterium HF4000_48E10]